MIDCDYLLFRLLFWMALIFSSSSAGFTLGKPMQRIVNMNATNNEAATPQELLIKSLPSAEESQWFTNSTVSGGTDNSTTMNATAATKLPTGASKEILSTKANETQRQRRKKRQSSQLNSQFDFGGSLQGTAYEGQDRLFQREPPQGVVNTRYAALEEWRARQGREFLSING